MPDFELNEDGLFVATREFLLRRGHCCGNGCRNCPYRGTPLDRRPAWLRARDEPDAPEVSGRDAPGR